MKIEKPTKQIIKKYAEAIVTVGANVQKGQDVFLVTSPEIADFTTLVVEACYKAGARHVEVDWQHQPLEIVKTNKESVDSLSEFRPYEKARLEYIKEHLPVRIYIDCDDPDGAKKMNHAKLMKVRQARYKFTKEYSDAIDNKYQWVIVGYPSKAWAKKVFPELTANQAYQKLLNAILYTARIDLDYKKNWDEHNARLVEKMGFLNSLDIDYLEYKSSNGTDFKVWLNSKCKWLGGGEYTSGSNIFFQPNMPTEEIFTTPIAGKAEGIVHSSKPLSYYGQLIEDFYFVFKDGKVVEAHAKKGEEILQQMVKMDNGACMIGEVALVPYESPINQTGILFYNTLYDENAACHIALGEGFTNLYEDYEKYTREELIERGVNHSMIHVDFMVGTKDLSIVAHLKNGEKIDIFKDGTWAS